MFCALQAALKTLKSEMTEKEKGMENEIEALRKAGRDRERDLDTLNSVLQCNQDIINVKTHNTKTTDGTSRIVVQDTHTHILTTFKHSVHVYFVPMLKVLFRLACIVCLLQDLRVALGEKEGLLKEVEKEKEVWRQRDRALAAVLQEKDSLIHCLKEELEKRQQVMYKQKGVLSLCEHCAFTVQPLWFKCERI